MSVIIPKKDYESLIKLLRKLEQALRDLGRSDIITEGITGKQPGGTTERR